MANSEYQRKYREKNREKLRLQSKEYRKSIRLQVLEHYGSACVFCGFRDQRALVIDHIENNGSEERKSLGGQHYAGWNFYLHLKRSGYPPGYQTLCWNCNAIKQFERNNSNPDSGAS